MSGMSEEKYKKDKNLSIELLRAFMIFETVLVHIWVDQQREQMPIFLWPFEYFLNKAVLVLMMISFYFLEPKLHGSGWSLWKRLRRVLVPYLFWGLIYWLYFIGSAVFQKQIGIDTGIKYLIKQFLNGGEVYPPYWFLLLLMILTVFYHVLFKLVKKEHAIYGVIFFSVVCVFLQYSGLNKQIWSALPMSDQYTFGRIAEVFPASAIGFCASHYRFSLRLKNRIVATLCFGFLILDILYGFFEVPDGYGFGGVGSLISATAVCIFTLNISTESMGKRWKTILLYCTKYTFGIYSLHVFAALLLYRITSEDGYSVSFGFNILVYVTAYLIAFAIGHLPGGFFKKLVE